MNLIVAPKKVHLKLQLVRALPSLLLVGDSHCHSSSESLSWVACPSTLLPAHLSVRFRFFLHFRMVGPYQFPLYSSLHVTVSV